MKKCDKWLAHAFPPTLNALTMWTITVSSHASNTVVHQHLHCDSYNHKHTTKRTIAALQEHMRPCAANSWCRLRTSHSPRVQRVSRMHELAIPFWYEGPTYHISCSSTQSIPLYVCVCVCASEQNYENPFWNSASRRFFLQKHKISQSLHTHPRTHTLTHRHTSTR